MFNTLHIIIYNTQSILSRIALELIKRVALNITLNFGTITAYPKSQLLVS